MPVIEIGDLADPALDVYARLTGRQLNDRRAPDKALFIAESGKVIGHALDAGYVPVSLLMERRMLEGPAAELVQRCGDVPVYTAPREVLASLTGYALTRGVLCAMRRPVLPAPEEICRTARRVAVLEDIVDPTNVGSIFRSAAALGMDAVLVTPSCCDPLHRRCVRVSMGSVFQVPWARLDAWPEAGLDLLRALGFTTAALALTDDAFPIDDPRPAALDKLALVLGTEGDGLRPETVARCDLTLNIPMAHGADSLNVNAASAVAFWQLRPQAPGADVLTGPRDRPCV